MITRERRHPVLAILLWVSLTGFGCGDIAAADPDTETSTPWPEGKYVSIEEVHQRWQARDPDMLLVNVVDEAFYDLGHIAGSLKITWDTLSSHLDQLNTNQHIVIYCRKGVRSESAYHTLVGNAYPHVWVMQGGIEAWRAKGYPTVPD